MTVDVEFEHDIETVYEALTDPDFLVDRCLALGELSAECEVERTKKVTTVRLVREIRRDLPKFLARLFGNEQITEMTEKWVPSKEGWRGDWTLEVQGQPVTVFADFALVSTATGCRYRVSHRAKAAIPLVGSKVEKYILSQTSDGAEDELNYLKRYLDERIS